MRVHDRRRAWRQRRGVALMLVLWLMIVLGMIAAGVASAARSATGIATNLRARAVGRYAAESGVVMASRSLRDNLALFPDIVARQAYLNGLEDAGAATGEVSLGNSRFTVTYVDVNSRLDVNAATAAQLARFFSFFVGPVEAEAAARSIQQWIGGGDPRANALRDYTSSRADLSFPRMAAARPLRTLETLRSIDGVPERLAIAAAPYLTVDGDGRINRVTASDTVLAAAAGSVENEPSRIMIVARGWLDGEPLTHEIQAVFAIEGNSAVLVRWRERDL